MANLTKNAIHKHEPRAGRRSYVAENAVTFFAGALVGVNAAGFMAKWADTVGHKFLGILLAPCVGNTSATPPVEGRVNCEGITLKDAAVAALAQTDVNALVFCTTDNPADLILTVATNVKAVGFVERFKSSGVGDVTLFTPAEYQGLI